MENEENIIGGPGGPDNNQGGAFDEVNNAGPDNNWGEPQDNMGDSTLNNLNDDGDFGIVDWEDDELPQGEPGTLNETPATPQEGASTWENPAPQYEASTPQYNSSEPQYNANGEQANTGEPQYNQNYNPSEPQAGDSWNYDAPQMTGEQPTDNNYGIPYAARTAQGKPESNKKLVAIVAVLGIIFMFALVKLVVNMFMGPNTKNTAKSQAQIEQTMQEAQQQMGDDFYKAASGENPEDAAVPSDGTENTAQGMPGEDFANDTTGNPSDPTANPTVSIPNESLVTVNLAANVGRVNPFLPMAGYAGYTSDLPKLPSAVGFPAPPTELTVNEPAIKLMETTISGIMFDAIAPSAIVKVEGKDHLVRKGDRINGYKILNITKDRVVVQNGTNVYRASVGETITTEQTGEVNFNTVDNLTTKFGGANAPKGTKMIQIN